MVEPPRHRKCDAEEPEERFLEGSEAEVSVWSVALVVEEVVEAGRHSSWLSSVTAMVDFLLPLVVVGGDAGVSS